MKRAKTRRLSLLRIAVTTSVILALINIILIGAAYQRRSAAEELTAERSILEENIASLKKINQDEVDELQAELDLIRSDVAELESSFPEMGAPFAIYQRAYELSQESQVDLYGISILSTDYHDTFAGTVVEKQYSLDLAGDMEDCIKYIGELERAGRDTLTLKSAILQPLEYSCSIDISLIGYFTAVTE